MKKSIYTIIFLGAVNFNLYGQWQQLNLNPSLSFSNVQFVNDTVGLINADNIILKTNDRGLSWDTIYSDINVVITDIFFFDKDTGYFAGRNSSASFLNKTFDGGNSWSTINMSVSAGKIFFTTTSTGFNYYLTIDRTIDGGANWTFTGGVPNSSGTGNIFFLTDSIGYAAGWYPGSIVKTTNAAATWQSQIAYDSHWDIFATSIDTAYSVGWDKAITKTTNGGAIWTPQISGLPSSSHISLYAIYCPDNNTCYVAGDSGTIIKTTNGGNNWEMQNSGIATRLSSVYCTDANTCYAVGSFGVVLQTANGGVGINEHPVKKK